MVTDWLRTDDIQEVISCLKTIKREINYVVEDINVWKTILMLQHNAMQATMVRALRQGSFLNVVSDRSKKAYMKYIECEDGSVEYKGSHLLSFNQLYERVKDTKYMSEPFISTEDVDMQIVRLNDFRNEFTHFSSTGWSIQALFFPDMILTSNYVISELIDNPRNWFLIDTKDKNQIHNLIESINQKVIDIRRTY